MKTRLGFVSNSSSSSFVISTKGRAPKIKVTLEVDLASLTAVTLRTVEDVRKYFIECYGCGPNTSISSPEDLSDYWAKDYGEGSRERFTGFCEAIKRGETVYVCEVANDDGNTLSRMIYDSPEVLKFPPEVTVLDKIG